MQVVGIDFGTSKHSHFATWDTDQPDVSPILNRSSLAGKIIPRFIPAVVAFRNGSITVSPIAHLDGR